MISSRFERSVQVVFFCSLASATLVVPACGGKDAGDRGVLGGGAGASGFVALDFTSCGAPEHYSVEMIDTFEGPTTAAEFTFEESTGRADFWTTNDVCARCTADMDAANALAKDVSAPDEEVEAAWDKYDVCMESCLEVQKPSFEAQGAIPTAALEEEHCGSTRAMRVQSGPFSEWGGAIGTSFSQGTLDVSQWEGISFWARKSPEPDAGRSLFLAITEKHTTEKQKTDPDYACGCTEGDDCDEAAEACDRFGMAVGLSQDWRFFAVPFEKMRQRGYGAPANDMDLEGLMGVAVYYETGTWDFWIDDLGFYRAKTED